MNKNFCRQCGMRLAPDAAVCPRCGRPLSPDSPVDDPAAAQRFAPPADLLAPTVDVMADRPVIAPCSAEELFQTPPVGEADGTPSEQKTVDASDAAADAGTDSPAASGSEGAAPSLHALADSALQSEAPPCNTQAAPAFDPEQTHPSEVFHDVFGFPASADGAKESAPDAAQTPTSAPNADGIPPAAAQPNFAPPSAPHTVQPPAANTPPVPTPGAGVPPTAPPNTYGPHAGPVPQAAAPHMPPYAAPPAPQYAAPRAPQYGAPPYPYASGPWGYGAPVQPDLVSTGSYLGMVLLGCIPLAGLIYLIVQAAGNQWRPNRRNFARGLLAAKAILLGALYVLVLLIGVIEAAGGFYYY